jgi:hypothetical protein
MQLTGPYALEGLLIEVEPTWPGNVKDACN